VVACKSPTIQDKSRPFQRDDNTLDLRGLLTYKCSRQLIIGSGARAKGIIMITRTKIGLLVGLMVVSLASSAMAQVLCLQTTVNKKTFKVTNKSVVAATCPKGYTAIANTSSFQGPAGATGASGSFNPNLCVKRTGTASGSGTINAQATCLVSEILVTPGCSTTSAFSYVREMNVFQSNNANFPELYGGVSCWIEDINGSAHTVTAQAMCCRP